MQVIIEPVLNIKPKLSVEKSFIKIICYFKKSIEIELIKAKTQGNYS